MRIRRIIGVAVIALMLPAAAYAQSSNQLRVLSNRGGGISGGLNGGIRGGLAGGLSGGMSGGLSGTMQNSVPRSILDRSDRSAAQIRARIRQANPPQTTQEEIPATQGTGTTPGTTPTQAPGVIRGTTQ